MSIATRTGDTGSTGLLNGRRVPKDHPQVEALGAYDELNVEIGAARLATPDAQARELLVEVHRMLIALMGEVACPKEDLAQHPQSGLPLLHEADLVTLDNAVARLEALPLALDGWATPGANPSSLAFERARVAARRAERRLAALGSPPSRSLLLRWTNRLSDVLWLLAREAEGKAPDAR